MVTRRTLLASASVTATLAALGITPEALAADRVKLGDAAPFSFDALIERARTMAGKPYTPLQRRRPTSCPRSTTRHTARSNSTPPTHSLRTAPASFR